MNRKILYSVGIILLLLGYIWFSRGTGSRNVPDLPDWEGSATEITIARPGDTIQMVKEGDRWVINDEKYPADPQRIEGLENRLRDLEITDLISSKGYYHNYDLTPDKAVSITVKQKGRTVRDIMLGKTGSTGRHTYIRIAGGKDVYQVTGVFTGETGGTVEDFRDKTVFSVEKDTVAGFSLVYRGKTFSFRKEMEPEKKDERSVKDKIEGAPEGAAMKFRWLCAGYEQTALDTVRIDGLLATFSPLKASGFAAIPAVSLKRPLAAVSLKASGKDVTLNIFDKEKKEDNRYLATSSESPYAFYIDEWKIKKYFIENLKDYTDNSR